MAWLIWEENKPFCRTKFCGQAIVEAVMHVKNYQRLIVSMQSLERQEMTLTRVKVAKCVERFGESSAPSR